MASKTALILGASGLVGSYCLRETLNCGKYRQVLVAGRREIPGCDPRVQQLVGDMTDLASLLAGQQVDDVFCCLGTTIRQAGSKSAFETVDREMPVAAARALRHQGLQHFLVISAMGADPESGIFYNRIKGLMEHDLQALELPALSIFRPSLLAGHREESRPMEKLGICAGRALRFAFVGPLKNYALIEGEHVARAMVKVAQTVAKRHRVYLSAEIDRLGNTQASLSSPAGHR